MEAAGRRWREAMTEALYGDHGFFRRQAPADHFRTSSHTGDVFAAALLTVLDRVDAALGRPDSLDLVDVGAGRGELLTRMLAAAPPGLRERLNPVAVELADRPEGLEAAIGWRPGLPERVTGLLVAVEWLDNVPLDLTREGRYVRVDGDGVESLGDPLDGPDRDWVARWWPDGGVAEIGTSRDAAWADAVGRLDAGLALAIDYGHVRARRPWSGTLIGYRGGMDVPPVPDGSCDLTAHVAADALAEAGTRVAGRPATIRQQAEALRALGVNGRRPDLRRASTDPGGYVRALAAASVATELTDPAGLGGHLWIHQPVAIPYEA